MENRTLLGIAAVVLAAFGILWGVVKAVDMGSGDAEFQKTLESLKQVKSFRGAYSATASSTSHSERTWEVDCNRVIVHQQSHDSQTNSDSPFDMREDELLVGNQRYARNRNGSWENEGDAGIRYSAKRYCESIASGGERELLPDLHEMISHAITQKGDKKTVNGVRCREWKFDVRTAISSRVGSICIGVDDHLPYELVMDGGRYSYSDYNQPIPLEAPDATLQPASSTVGSTDGSN